MASRFVTVLRQRDMRFVLGAYLIDDTASWGYSVVLAAYAYERTGSTSWIALVACSRWIAGLFVSGYAGVIADRFDRAKLIAVTGVLCAVSMVVLTVVISVDGPLWLLPTLSIVDTVLSSPVRPATGALLPDVVPESELIAANSLFAVLENVVIVVGPAIGGLLLLAGTPETAMGINAASYLIASALYLRVRTRSRGDVATGEAEAGRLAQWGTGLRVIARNRAAVLLSLFLALAAGVYGAAIVVYAPLSEQFGTGPEGYTYLLAASALGSVLAAALAERLSARARLAPLLVGAIVVEAAPFGLSHFVHNAWLGAALQTASGAGVVLVDVLAITALQRDLPRASLGRALAATGAVALAATVIGDLGSSAIISNAGLAWTLGVIGIGFPAVALACLPALIGSDRATAARARELQPVVAMIEQLDLFEGASQRVLEQLAAGAEARSAAAGEVLIRQGDVADALWLLESGVLAVAADGTPLPDVTAPGYVGELGLLHNRPRSATVTVREPAALIRIDGDTFRASAESAAASSSLMTLAGERLARTPRRDTAAQSAALG
jgi:MFS family permease